MKELFSIGEVAHFQHISKQTLIYYDQIGLFRPAYVDPQNGYRYYAANQLDLLDTILILKRCGLSLKEIQQQLKERNLQNSCDLLLQQQNLLTKKIEELTSLRKQIQQKRNTLQNLTKELCKEQIYVTTIEECPLLCEPVLSPYQTADISIATKKCFTRAFQNAITIYFQIGVRVPLQKLKKKEYEQADMVFLPVDDPSKTQHDQLLPRGKCVIGIHHGRYEDIGTTYEKIFSFCHDQGLQILSDSYEFCIHDHLTSNDTNDYITKIHFYVC